MAEQQRSTFVGFLDAFAKFMIAAVGVLATWYFNFAEAQRSERQIAAETEARLEDTFARYFAMVPSDPAVVATANDGELALVVATRAAIRLRDEFGHPDYFELLEARTTPAQAAVVRNIELQSAEASIEVAQSSAPVIETGAPPPPPPAAEQRTQDVAPAPGATGEAAPSRATVQERVTRSAQGTEQWFAVAASYPMDDRAGAEAFANELRARLQAAGMNANVSLWETRISRNIAVCVGGTLSRDEATQLAATMRERNIVPDAFAQRNREWGRPTVQRTSSPN